MSNYQEWLTSNKQRRFPLADADADALSAISSIAEPLEEFLLDLRLFTSPYESVNIFIKTISLSGDGLNYTLDFGDVGTGDTILTGTVPVQESPPASDEGKKRYFTDGPMVVLFVPGASWNDPSLMGLAPGGSLSFATTDERDGMRIQQTNVNTDIRSFKGFYLVAPFYDSAGNLVEIDEAVPAEDERPTPTYNVMEAGYNIAFAADDDGEVVIDLQAGAGAGLYPCQETDCRPKIRKINGVTADDGGNLSLEFYDCLRHSALNETDPETLEPVTNGLKLHSDCLPCCNCEDYNHTSLAISRQSAKLKDVNDQMVAMLQKSQKFYDEAIALMNAQSPGLIAIYNVDIQGFRICFDLMNVSNLPAYAVISINDTPAVVDLTIEPGQTNVVAGAETSSPPLTGLSGSSKDSGITDPADSDGWTDYGLTATVGTGAFTAIPPAGIGRVCFYSPGIKTIFDDLSNICENLQVYFGGSLGEALLAADGDYQSLKTQYDTLSIVDADCLAGGVLPTTEDDYRCQVQSEADAIRRAELRDKMLARKYELAFDVSICGTNALTADMLDLITRLEAIDTYVGPSCKDGSFSCSSDGPPGFEGFYGCEADLYGDVCRSNIRAQYIERSKIYAELNDVLQAQVEHLNSLVETCLGSGMLVDSIDTLDISLTSIYGSLNFSCNAHNQTIDLDRTDETGGEYECLKGIYSILQLST